MIALVPHSNGIASFQEFNGCHGAGDGKFCSGAGAPSLDLAPGMAGSIKDMEAGGNWQLRFVKTRDRDSHEYSIEPKTLPAGIRKVALQIAVNGEVVRTQDRLYDPSMATLEATDYALNDPTLKAGWDKSIPEEAEPGYLYRGMSFGEWEAAQRSGYLQSTGDYNLGDAQVGLTFFSTHSNQAASYAAGFAPWQFAPTFGRPAIVVKVKDPGTARSFGTADTERGVPGRVSVKDVSEVFEGHVYSVRPGMMELYRDHNGYTEGSRSTPSVNLGWRRVKRG